MLRPSVLPTSALLAVFSFLPLHAAFDVHLDGARSAALGRTFLSADGEAGALFGHPAGLASVPAPEVSLMYGKPYHGLKNVGLQLGHAAAAVPLKGGVLGFGYARFQVEGLLAEETTAVSYGRSLGKSVQAGVTGKRLSHGYEAGSDALAQADPVFRNGTSKSAFAFDAGITASAGKHLRFGAAGRNLNEPNVGLAGEDKVERQVQAGAQVDLASLGIKISGDLQFRRTAPGAPPSGPAPFFGVEKTLLKEGLALRAGANREEFTGGFGLKLGAVGFDYAFLFNKNLKEDNGGSHRLGLAYRLGRKK
ncbi:MAG: type IX secretion system membrane protein PorP/SprF [Elusimicrobiota bacterium]